MSELCRTGVVQSFNPGKDRTSNNERTYRTDDEWEELIREFNASLTVGLLVVGFINGVLDTLGEAPIVFMGYHWSLASHTAPDYAKYEPTW